MTSPLFGPSGADLPLGTGVGDDDFDLDVRIVERGPVAEVLLASTDDGCDTVKTGDC